MPSMLYGVTEGTCCICLQKLSIVPILAAFLTKTR